MSNAELSVRLFLGSVCMFAFALGVNQAGWRHRFLIVSLFVLSAMSGLGAVFFPSISAGWPTFTLSLENIASDAWAWFWLIALLSVSVIALSIRDLFQTGSASQPREIARDTAPIQWQDAGNVTAELVARPLTPLPADRYESPGLTRAQELMDLCASRTDAEIKQIASEHAGEILELSGIVYDVSTYGDVSATISIDADPAKPGLIHARIADKDRAMRAISLRRGDKLKVSGKITDMAKNSISLIDCEFTRF
jgi:hypothetical protein